MDHAVANRAGHRNTGWVPRPIARHSSEAPDSSVSHNLEQDLAQLRREHDQLRHTLFQAAQVQRRLCGTRHWLRRPYEVASEIFPLQDLSGDFIAVFEDAGDLVCAIGDICGKGLAAGMWFTHVVSTLRQQCMTNSNPARAMAAVNEILIRSEMELPYTSLLLCRLRLSTGEITYCNAGHPPGLIFDCDGGLELMSEGGPLLGAIAGAAYAAGKTYLKPGMTLLGFSDGVVECGAGVGDEFGVERVLAKAQSTNGSAVGTLFSVLGAVEDFAGGRGGEDDLALMVVRRDMNA